MSHDADARPPETITWVGQQWRMEGYCGRATANDPPNVSRQPLRPVAVVRNGNRRRRERIVRIGPPRLGGNDDVAAAA